MKESAKGRSPKTDFGITERIIASAYKFENVLMSRKGISSRLGVCLEVNERGHEMEPGKRCFYKTLAASANAK